MADEAGYEVLERLGNDVELRKYGRQTWILYHHLDNNKAFTHLRAYIEGRNEDDMQIPMTVPVASGTDEEGFFLAFILPADLEKAPPPLDKSITIREIKERKLAVIPLIGYVGPESLDRDRRILEKTVKERGLKAKGNVLLLQYSSPRTPPHMQRTEAGIEVE